VKKGLKELNMMSAEEVRGLMAGRIRWDKVG
jgi:hypothetical protein